MLVHSSKSGFNLGIIHIKPANSFIFSILPSICGIETDLIRQGIIDWATRTQIIEGISQGLLYLHQYSRLQIIHRNLKASNILLDKDMNPKILDFGMARISFGNGSQATNRIVGT